jgi:hypothetical protein
VLIVVVAFLQLNRGRRYLDRSHPHGLGLSGRREKDESVAHSVGAVNGGERKLSRNDGRVFDAKLISSRAQTTWQPINPSPATLTVDLGEVQKIKGFHINTYLSPS